MKSEKLVIGFILDDTLDRVDGVQQSVITIGEKLRALGHDIHYIVSDTKRTDLENIHSIGKLISLKFNGNSVRTPVPTSRKKIKKLFDEYKFDVLHVQMPYSPFFAASVLKQAPKTVKKFGTFHILPYGIFANFSTKLLGLVLKDSIKLLDEVFAVSKPANKFMYETFSVVGEIVPNPVDYQYFHSFKKQKQTKKQVVFVGRFEQRKGVRELILAYSKLNKYTLERTELVMCGKGPLLEEMRQLSKNLDLSIKFPGFVTNEEKAQYLANSDVAVFPSISGESFGIVLTEAMSAGAGITIGGNNPGYNSVLEEWPETLFDPRSIAHFAEVLDKHINKPSNTGKKQQKEVQKYDICKVVDILLQKYRQID